LNILAGGKNHGDVQVWDFLVSAIIRKTRLNYKGLSTKRMLKRIPIAIERA